MVRLRLGQATTQPVGRDDSAHSNHCQRAGLRRGRRWNCSSKAIQIHVTGMAAIRAVRAEQCQREPISLHRVDIEVLYLPIAIEELP